MSSQPCTKKAKIKKKKMESNKVISEKEKKKGGGVEFDLLRKSNFVYKAINSNFN